jgi:hypothetical protein
MVAIENRPELQIRSGYGAELLVERSDILFHDLGPDRVRIQITVHNTGTERSRPTLMRLESAPLGAFVPWQPLTQIPVPALGPGESRDLSAEVTRRRPAPLGDFNRVPPKKLLTAVNSPDQPRTPGIGIWSLLNLFRKRKSTRNLSAPQPSTLNRQPGVGLARDLWDFLRRGQPHWAGNINVFIGNHSVERHMATALRVYPGRTNLAIFMVGGPGARDSFAFELVGLPPAWKAALYDETHQKTLAVGPSDAAIEERQWITSNGSQTRGLLVLLATHPPVGCESGNVEVHVTRQSDGQTAIVEFNLDPAAQGPGCYSA